MKKVLMLMMATAVAFASCTKESFKPVEIPAGNENLSVPQFFSAHMEKDLTKSEFTGSNNIWTPDDEVFVFPGSTQGVRYDVEQDAYGSSTTTLVSSHKGLVDINGDGVIDENDGYSASDLEKGDPIPDNVAFYPYWYRNGEKLTYSDGKYTIPVNIRTASDYDSFGEIPMVAVTDGVSDTDLYFKNIFGLLRIPVISDGGNLLAIEVKGNNGEKISGKGTITVSKGSDPVFEFSSTAEESMMVWFPYDSDYLGTPLSDTATDFYIPLPPTTFEHGITVTFYGWLGDAVGTVTKTSSAELVINRSKIRSMADIDFGPTPTILYYESTDGSVVEPTRLIAKDKNGTTLSYSNVYDYDPLLEDMVGMIKINGAARDIDISFAVPEGTESKLYSFIGSLCKTNLVSGKNMFTNCKNLDEVYMPRMSTEKVTDMSYMFDGCTSLYSIEPTFFDVYEMRLTNFFDTGNVTDMTGMFRNCTNFHKTYILSIFNTEKVTSMAEMFSGCESIEEIDLSDFNTANVTDMSGMFSRCSSLRTLEFGDEFNTAKVTSMDHMFSEYSQEELDLTKLNTSNVTSMAGMFANSTYLKRLNISNFDTSKVTSTDGMFTNCPDLKFIKVGVNTLKFSIDADPFAGVGYNGTLNYPAGLDVSEWLKPTKGLGKYGWNGTTFGEYTPGGYPGYDETINW